MSVGTKAFLLFGQECLDNLTAEAKANLRQRKNRDFHDGPAHPAQRLLNAVEPGSYVRPHRHLNPLKDETVIAIRGTFGVIFFDENGAVTSTALIAPNSAAVGVNIPCGLFHTLLSLEPGSVFFEAKAGPYEAQSDKDWPQWAPVEGRDEASAYLEGLRALFAGKVGTRNRPS